MSPHETPDARQTPPDGAESLPERPSASEPAETPTAGSGGRTEPPPPELTSGHHIGREWSGHKIEDNCPCPKVPCGLVDQGNLDPACNQHPWTAAKSIRQSHPADACPGPTPEPAA